MRFNFLVLCTTFVHTWTLGNGSEEQHSVWMGHWVSGRSCDAKYLYNTSLDSFDVEGYIYAGVHNPDEGQVLADVESSNYNWFVYGYKYKDRGMLCNDRSVGNVRLDGALYVPSLVFYLDGKDLSKQLTLQSIKFGFQLGSPRTWFISNNCFPFNGNQDKPEEAAIHFSCCIVTDELGELYDMMVYAKPIGFNDYGSGTAGYFGYFDIAYGPLDEYIPALNGWTCFDGSPRYLE